MALINCPECSRQISSAANACPHCGYPLSVQKSGESSYCTVAGKKNDAHCSNDSGSEQLQKKKTSKKIFVTVFSTVIVIAILIAVALSCTKTGVKPDDVSDEHYSYGKRALDIIDQYLDDKIDASTADKRIDNLIDSERYKLPETLVGDKANIKGLDIEYNVVSCSIILSNINYGTGSQDDLLEHRNKIAEALNEKKR